MKKTKEKFNKTKYDINNFYTIEELREVVKRRFNQLRYGD